MSPELAHALGDASGDTRRVLECALEDREISWQEAELLCSVEGSDLSALVTAADALRQRHVGDTVTYVVNRNVNFTNVCVKACKFCAFSRTHRSEQGYFLSTEEIVRRAAEAQALGATEVCIQAGLPPGVNGSIYVDLCRELKRALPSLHVHAFSPEEIKYGAGLSGMSIREHIAALKDVGLGSIPGTSAEILDDSLRKRLAGGRISTAEWVHVIGTAHELGVPTTSTVMFGHIETHGELVRHLDVLRTIQRNTGGFTEFVPLSFVHSEAPLYAKQLIRGVRPGPTPDDVVRLFAIARVFLGASFKNIQASWVKEGPLRAQRLLACGANDLGGTLMNESISTAAGAPHGQWLPPRELRRLAREVGRVPAQRDTLYRLLRVHDASSETDVEGPLDALAHDNGRFGSYAELVRDKRHAFRTVRSS
ncbi:MAG TPA: 5-amino-6-(D-ribitylamino)uracil--L-tyrosine 4-hydroxyphenyl transferase CofH [Polyangiaceae bacterium]